MTTFVTKKLAFSRLADAKGDLYDPLPATKALVHNILLHNGNTTTEVATLNYHDGTDEYPIYKISLGANETVQLTFGNEGLLVDAASKLTGLSTTADKVTCLIMGSEEAD
ncbi:MAG: hypothetical protein GYA58_03260 [Anaerolineaceae bacterium]|nr:hypothetical protein [Anaerolineaceae bacterium]